jgi:hypothetical protein
MSSIDIAVPAQEPTPEELLARRKSILSTEVFKSLNRSPKKILVPGGALRAMKSLAKTLAESGIEATAEEVQAYLATGALADANIGIGWDGEKYLLVAPGEEMPAPKVEVAQEPAPPTPKEEVVSVEPEDAPVVEKVAKKENPFPEWGTLREMKTESKLAILKSMYDYLRLGASEKGKDDDKWYLNPEVERTFPTEDREQLDLHPELVGYDGKAGTFGGFLVSLKLAAKYDTSEADGSFKNHIKLLPTFRSKSISFDTALEIVSKRLTNKQRELLAYVLGAEKNDDVSSGGPEKEYADFPERDDAKSIKLRRMDRAAQTIADATARLKRGVDKRSPVTDVRRAAVKDARITRDGKDGEVANSRGSAEGDEWLKGREAEVRAADGKEGELSFAEEVRLAKLRHAFIYDKYQALIDNQNISLDAKVRLLTTAATESVETAMRLERLRSRTEREPKSKGLLNELDRGILAIQLEALQGLMLEIDKALKNQRIGSGVREELTRARANVNGVLKQYGVKEEIPDAPVAITDNARRLASSLTMALTHESEAAALSELPERRFEIASSQALDGLASLERRELPIDGMVGLSAQVLANLKAMFDAVVQMKKNGQKVAVERRVFTPIQLAIKQSVIPDDYQSFRTVVEEFSKAVSTLQKAV